MKILHLGEVKSVDPIAMEYSHDNRTWSLVAGHNGIRTNFLLSEVVPLSEMIDPARTAVAFIIPEHIRDA